MCVFRISNCFTTLLLKNSSTKFRLASVETLFGGPAILTYRVTPSKSRLWPWNTFKKPLWTCTLDKRFKLIFTITSYSNTWKTISAPWKVLFWLHIHLVRLPKPTLLIKKVNWRNRVQSHMWLTGASCSARLHKYSHISSYIRKPFFICTS